MQYGSYSPAVGTQRVCWLPMESISPRVTCTLGQANEQNLMGLAESIRINGLLKPIVVKRTENGRYVVVSGNRRLLACRMLGMTHIDAVTLLTGTEAGSAQQLVEGILSGRMHYLEQARALQLLHTMYSLTREEMANTLRTSPLELAERMRLNALPDELQALLMEEGVPERIAQMLLRLPDDESRLRIARQTVQQRLSPREVEALVSSTLTRLTTSGRTGGRTIACIRDHRLYLNALRSMLAQMKEAGVETSFTEVRKADRIEITVSLSTRKRRCQQ